MTDVSHYWGQDVRFDKNTVIDYVDPIYYYGRKRTVSGTVVPFVRPVENKITLSLFEQEMTLDFCIEWNKNKEKWVKVPGKRTYSTTVR